MTLTELRYIVTLARDRHFGRAAEHCHVSQPTLSIAVKKLEDELGLVIFERIKHSIRVTPLGQQVIDQAEKVLNEASVIKRIAESGKDPLNSPLRLGAIFTIGPYLFPHLIPQMQRLAPKMSLYLEENYTAILRKKLISGELDVIVIALPFTEKEVLTKSLYDESFVLLLPENHPLAENGQIDRNEITSKQMLLLGEGHCFRDQVLKACPGILDSLEAEPDASPITEGSSLETLRHMVASGFGITILPQTAAGTQYYAEGLLTTRRFKSPTPSRTVALAWRTSFTRPQVIDVLNQAIRACQLSTPSDSS